MSSHREAPAISQDPAADSTDVYAFVDPVNPELVTIIANYIPLQEPAGGPTFYEFGGFTPSVKAGSAAPLVYDININNDGTGTPNITYRFTFTTTIPDPNSFLYANYPIAVQQNAAGGVANPPYNLDSAANDGGAGGWNRPQTYTVQKIVAGVATPIAEVTGATLYCPPCNVGPRTTPKYDALASAVQYTLVGGIKVFAGQRAEAFWVDLGSIFDLGDLRPLSGAHLVPGATTNGINPLAGKNVHSIAIQVPISTLVKAPPTSATDPNATIGIWTSASRPSIKMQNSDGTYTFSGNSVQVSRLGMPLVNEAVVPLSLKDYFNSSLPANDSQYAAAIVNPELQNRLIELYPGAFPNLKAFIAGGGKRTDLVAIFGTGIPSTVIPGFAGTYQTAAGATPVVAEMLRLNTQIAPVAPGAKGYSPLGLLGGDIGGFPNGRRVGDDIVTIELQAVAGATIALTNPGYKADAVIASTGINEKAPFDTAAVTGAFPYLADPWPGFSNPTGTPTQDNGSTGVNFAPTS